MTAPAVSVVIPALNEAVQIIDCIESAWLAGAREVIVADGGSHDATIDQAESAGATTVVRSLPGRGVQQNSGAMFARQGTLLFLHADCRLPAESLKQIAALPPSWVWGAMRQHIDDPSSIFRWIERGNAARVRRLKMAFGDQAIFVRRDAFKRIGGFPEIPLMEDVELSKALRKIDRPYLIDGPVTISARRWRRRGVVRQTWLNWRIQVAYKFGVSPETLASWYR